jgi:hypothetical protein
MVISQQPQQLPSTMARAPPAIIPITVRRRPSSSRPQKCPEIHGKKGGAYWASLKLTILIMPLAIKQFMNQSYFKHKQGTN